MSMKLAVDMKTELGVTVDIELEDADLAKIANDLEKSVEELELDDVREAAIEKAFNENQFTGLCVHCSGYGMGSNFSADTGDLDVDDNEDAIRIKK